MRSFTGRDILSLNEFERQEFFRVFEIADRLEPIARNRQNTDLLRAKTMVTAFYQPSTRTRLSHEAAMHRLGGRVTGFADPKTTRAGDFYQESLKDTVRMLEAYGDVIVMRHFQAGAPQEAAGWSSVPVINAGDGWGEHPTQVLTDLYTVLRERGRIDGLRWLAVGDMRMRTMHSLGHALSQFDCPVTFVAPPADALFPGSPDMRMPEEYKARFARSGLDFREAEHVEQAIVEADVILVEPVIQPDYTLAHHEASEEARPSTPANYKITRELLAAKAKSDAIVLHSLPRMDELPQDIDTTRWSRLWQEAFNGVVVRMALLALVLGAVE
ncbi:aspartate carbamoyltransferase [Streptomyces sp. NBC_00986]|uniref:aspartate carbamoyltransferase n=1 Tax=Streptomyces sp. NBC_00986 TaxID=2903702 RepID=UPI00386A5DF1|nr:aspartate carbamoyltransferase [Streptomyces sp. NBC_00986]